MPPLFPEDAPAKPVTPSNYNQKPTTSLQQTHPSAFSRTSLQEESDQNLPSDFNPSCESPSSMLSSLTMCTVLEDGASNVMTDSDDTADRRSNEPPRAAQPPLSLTPQQLLEGLEESFMETVLVDARVRPVAVLTGAVCVEALGHLIESPFASPTADPSSPFMVSDNPLSTFASERLNYANGPLQTFDERLKASHVVVYDDEGNVGGPADRVARALRQSGRCQSSRHLEGGLNAWIQKFGNSLLDPAAWAVRDGITVEEEPAAEIQQLRARQAKLVQGVWHTKPIPWHIYLGQCGDGSVVENGIETPNSSEQVDGADKPDSGTLFVSEDDCVEALLAHAPTSAGCDDGFGEFLSASSLSSPLSPHQIVPCQDYPHEILPNLYLGGETTALEDRLRAYEIKHVVRIGWFWTPLVEGIRYFDYCLLDEIAAADSIQRVIPQAIEAIACALATGESVLVHCQAGVSRSATIVLAYLMRYHSLTLRQAWDLAFRIRPIIRPNKGFAQVLLRYEEQLKSEGIIPASMPLSSTVRFAKNTESQVPIPLYWVCESFDHYREFLEAEIRLRHIRSQLEAAQPDAKSPSSPATTVSVASLPQSPASTLSCPSPPPFDFPDLESNKLVTERERMDVSVVVREE